MFTIDSNRVIHITRGDFAVFDVNATSSSGDDYAFDIGDVVRFKVYERNRPDKVVLTKDINVDTRTLTITFRLERLDTKIGDLISKPKDYWYEVELNPDTCPDTFIGYDADGPKIFRLYPEGDGDV